MIYHDLSTAGYNFGFIMIYLLRLYLMWFEICKYMYFYIDIQYMHCMPWVPCELLYWFLIWILSDLIWLMDLLMFDSWKASQESSHTRHHTHNTHTWSHTLLYLYKWYNMQILWYKYIYICICVKRHIDIKTIIYIYIQLYAHNDAVYTCSNVYVCVAVRVCMW